MKIAILGPGCSKCELMQKHVQEAVTELGIHAEIEKITDPDQILDLGVMFTPGLVIDNEVKSTGKVLSKDQVISILKGEN